MTMQDDTTNTPPTVQPTGLELDELIDSIKVVKWATASYPLIPPKEKARLKQALTRWGLEQQLAELNHLDKAMDEDSKYHWPSEDGEYYDVNAYITDRTTQLKANLQDGGTQHG